MVWAIVLSVPKAMREPENEIRQYVPTPFYFITAYRREQVKQRVKHLPLTKTTPIQK